MDVGISQLRSNLKGYVERAQTGEDIVVTERGVPVARLVAVNGRSVIERLEHDGVLTRPTGQRRHATGRARASGPVAELVTELRR